MLTEKQLAVLYEKADTSDDIIKSLEREYRELGRVILAELLLLYATATPSLREYQVPFTLSKIDEAVDSSMSSIQDTLFRKVKLIYTRVLKDTSSPVTDMDSRTIEDILDKAWAKDGKTLTARITKVGTDVKISVRYNLYERLQDGDSKQLIKDVSSKYSKQFYKLDRITRTEVNRLINEALKFSAEMQGFAEYRYSAVLDRRTSTICRQMDGQVFPFVQYRQGVNAPPLHQYCRSFIVPLNTNPNSSTL